MSSAIQTTGALGETEADLFVKENLIDYSEIPELSDSWFLQAKRATQVPRKKQVSLRIDEDILEFFKLKGSRYQTKMHAVLRAYVDNSRNPKTR